MSGRPDDLHGERAEQPADARRPRRLHADQQRQPLLGRLLDEGVGGADAAANIGDELNAAGVSWGYFKGGFRPTTTFAQATGGTQPTSDFIPHEFAKSTFYKSDPHAASNEGLCNS